MGYLKLFIIAIGLVAIDQLTKFLVLFYFSEIIVKNSGIAFGLPMPYPEIIVGIVLIAFVIYYFKRSRKKGLVLPFVLVVSGGISNLIDRIRLGYIVDFIDLKILPIFNLADVYIFFGVLIFVLFLLKKK